jgi:tetratricopeptide (TPR) repeat protein
MKTFRLVVVLALLAVPGVSLAADPQAEALTRILTTLAQEVDDWEALKNAALCILIAIATSGALVAVLQALAAPWSKMAVITLGALVTLLTAVGNIYLDLDFRQYRSLVARAKTDLAELEYFVLSFSKIPAENARARDEAFADLSMRVRELRGLPDRYKHPPGGQSGSARAAGSFLVSTAHAAGLADINGLPEWVTTPPRDESRLYFVGYGDARTLTEAGLVSKEVAFEEARRFFADRLQGAGAPSLDTEVLARYIAASGSVEKTYYVFERSKLYFRFFTLVSINKRLIGSDLELFAAKEATPIPPAVVQSLKSVARSPNDYLSNRLSVYGRAIEKARGTLSDREYDRFVRARNLRLDGESVESTAILKDLVRLRPDFYMGWFDLALAYDKANNTAAAREAYERARVIEGEQNISDASLYNSYGYFLYRHDRFSEAIPLLQRALEIAPDHPKAKGTLAASQAAFKRERAAR